MGIVLEDGFSIENTDNPPGTPWIGWHNVVNTSNTESNTEDEGFPISNIANPATHLFWRGGINTAMDERVTVTLPAGIYNYIAVAKHNFGTEEFTISVDGKNGNSPDIYETLIDDFTPDDDSTLIMRFTEQPLTHIRLRMQGGEDVPQAAVLYVGRLLVMERGLDPEADHVPLPLGRRSTIVNGMSESGNFLGRVSLKEWRESTAKFAKFTPDWYRDTFEDFIEASKTIPFFFAWHPITYPDETGFAWLLNDPAPDTKADTERVSFELQMRGIA